MPQDVRDWSWSMVTKQDNEMRVIVASIKRDGTAFKVQIGEADGSVRDQWFKLSKQGPTTPVLPAVGADIIVGYNISPGTVEWPNDTYWANSIRSANGVDETPAPPMADVPPAYEQTAQRVDAVNEQHDGISAADMRDAASEIADRKKDVYQAEGDARNQSIEMQVCLKAAVEITKEWEGGAASQQVVEVTLALHDGIFCGKAMPTHEEQAPRWQMPTEEPNQEAGEPERQFSG